MKNVLIFILLVISASVSANEFSGVLESYVGHTKLNGKVISGEPKVLVSVMAGKGIVIINGYTGTITNAVKTSTVFPIKVQWKDWDGDHNQLSIEFDEDRLEFHMYLIEKTAYGLAESYVGLTETMMF